MEPCGDRPDLTRGSSDPPLSTLRISASDMTALHVRTCPRNASRPQFLYQALPDKAAGLIATIPTGAFAVSIPHSSDLRKGYEILRTPPPDGNGFMIVYALQPDRRYVAVEIRFHGRSYGIADFRETARQWMQSSGDTEYVSGQYGYLAPNLDLWGVLLRDHGYIALDPLQISSDITPELQSRTRDRQGSGIIARIPVEIRYTMQAATALPVFARVELTRDAHPAPQSHWISFDEYRESRTKQSRPPASIIPDFLEWMKRLSAESKLRCWVFRPGMLFGDCTEWWGDRNRRRTQHEGLDFAEGIGIDTTLQAIPEGTPVRAMADGEVLSLLDDFLGKTAVIRHSAMFDTSGRVFHTLYSHILPETGLHGPLAKGQLLGTVRKSTNAATPPHLHMAGAWIPQDHGPEEITLDRVSHAYSPVMLADFKNLIPGIFRTQEGTGLESGSFLLGTAD